MRLWGELESCSQRSDETIEEFVDRFKRCYELVRASKKETKIPGDIRAFMLLRRARKTEAQRMLVLSKMNSKDVDKMLDTMCKELKLVLGGGPGQRSAEHEQVKKVKEN